MTPLQMMHAMSMLSSDRPKGPVDALFFNARSFGGDDDGLFELVHKFMEESMISAVVVNGGDGRSADDPNKKAWPGTEYYQGKLYNVFGCQVIPSRPAVHTLDEAFAFNEVAKNKGLRSVITIGQPFHLPCIMLSHLLAMRRQEYSMQVFAAAPTLVDYTKPTNGNQGAAGVVRFKQIEMEYDRIIRYQAQGNLASTEELLGYLTGGRMDILRSSGRLMVA